MGLVILGMREKDVVWNASVADTGPVIGKSRQRQSRDVIREETRHGAAFQVGAKPIQYGGILVHGPNETSDHNNSTDKGVLVQSVVDRLARNRRSEAGGGGSPVLQRNYSTVL